jgi:hypothetical protein
MSEVPSIKEQKETLARLDQAVMWATKTYGTVIKLSDLKWHPHTLDEGVRKRLENRMEIIAWEATLLTNELLELYAKTSTEIYEASK